MGPARPRLEVAAGFPILSSVLLFKRIFDFPRSTLARLRNKRRSERCPVAPGFPLKATLTLLGSDQPARSKAAPGSGLPWGGAVADLSGGGLSLRLPPAAVTARGEQTVLVLALEDFELRLPCTVAHFRTQSAGATCGLSLQFENDTQRKGYAQLVEAVVVGAGFVADKPVKAKGGLVSERYRSERQAVLTVWRAEADGPWHAFELVVGAHTVRGVKGQPAPEVLVGGNVCSGGVEKQEVIRLFRIVAANLPKALPADLRQGMQALAKPPSVRR